MPKRGRTHGRRSTYRWGCRCDDCCEAERFYNTARKRVQSARRREELLPKWREACARRRRRRGVPAIGQWRPRVRGRFVRVAA